VLIVHAGNRIDRVERAVPRFPPEWASSVADSVRRLLLALQPIGVVSAPAGGADLILLSEAQLLGIPVHILVAIPDDRFIVESVSDCGPEWVERFHDVLAKASADEASSIDRTDLGDQPKWYLAANELLLHRAAALAADQPVLALTVRPPGSESPPSATDDFARSAAERDLVVLSLDPRPNHSVITVE
jgi:hypothetical protein